MRDLLQTGVQLAATAFEAALQFLGLQLAFDQGPGQVILVGCEADIQFLVVAAQGLFQFPRPGVELVALPVQQALPLSIAGQLFLHLPQRLA